MASKTSILAIGIAAILMVCALSGVVMLANSSSNSNNGASDFDSRVETIAPEIASDTVSVEEYNKIVEEANAAKKAAADAKAELEVSKIRAEASLAAAQAALAEADAVIAELIANGTSVDSEAIILAAQANGSDIDAIMLALEEIAKAQAELAQIIIALQKVEEEIVEVEEEIEEIVLLPTTISGFKTMIEESNIDSEATIMDFISGRSFQVGETVYKIDSTEMAVAYFYGLGYVVFGQSLVIDMDKAVYIPVLKNEVKADLEKELTGETFDTDVKEEVKKELKEDVEANEDGSPIIDEVKDNVEEEVDEVESEKFEKEMFEDNLVEKSRARDNMVVLPEPIFYYDIAELAVADYMALPMLEEISMTSAHLLELETKRYYNVISPTEALELSEYTHYQESLREAFVGYIFNIIDSAVEDYEIIDDELANAYIYGTLLDVVKGTPFTVDGQAYVIEDADDLALFLYGVMGYNIIGTSLVIEGFLDENFVFMDVAEITPAIFCEANYEGEIMDVMKAMYWPCIDYSRIVISAYLFDGITSVRDAYYDMDVLNDNGTVNVEKFVFGIIFCNDCLDCVTTDFYREAFVKNMVYSTVDKAGVGSTADPIYVSDVFIGSPFFFNGQIMTVTEDIATLEKYFSTLGLSTGNGKITFAEVSDNYFVGLVSLDLSELDVERFHMIICDCDHFDSFVTEMPYIHVLEEAIAEELDLEFNYEDALVCLNGKMSNLKLSY